MFSMKMTTMAVAALFVFGCLISSATAQGSGRSLLERLGRLGVLTKGKCPVTTTQDNFDSARVSFLSFVLLLINGLID